MAEIIDILFVGWCLLALGVFIVGQLLDKQLERTKTPGNKASRTTNLDDFWAPPTHGGSSGHYEQSSAYRRSNDFSTASSHYGQWQGSSGPRYNEASHYSSLSRPIDYAHNDQHLRSNSYQFNAADPFSSSSSSATKFTSYRPYGLDEQAASSHGQQRGAQTLAPGTIPTATGFNADCVEWVNSILYLFYTRPEKYGPVIGENVCRSLNEKLTNITSSSGEHANLLIEFEGICNELSSRPELTNVRTECESDKSVSASCKLYNERIVFNLLIRRLMLGAQDEQRYELVLERLEGKLKGMTMLGDKLIVIQFIEKPDTKILLRPTGRRSQPLINEDVLVQMIVQTITQVVVDLYFGNDLEFPQFKPATHQSAYSSYKHKFNSLLRGSASELKRSLKHDLFGAPSGSATAEQQQQKAEQKVFVKITRAKNINYNQNVTCLMELDVPKQQAISSTKQGSNPVWDEHFLFNVNEKSQELTFELWDSLELSTSQSGFERREQATRSGARKTTTAAAAARWQEADLSSAKFLGLARVAVEELRQNPVRKVSLSLEPAVGQPHDLSHSVGGELQLELLFLDNPSRTGAVSPTTPAHANTMAPKALHKSSSLSSLAYQPGDVVSVDRKLTPSGYVITTTTITKQPATASRQQQQQKYDQLLQPQRPQSPAGSSSMATEHSFDEMRDLDATSGSNMSAGAAGASEQTGADGRSEGRLSRSRSRSRSFLRAVKKRFSFSRTRRSRSVGESLPTLAGGERPGTVQSTGSGGGGGASRSRASSEVSVGAIEGGRAKSVPARSREPSEVPTIVINKGRRSDTASALSFEPAKSQLVIEVFEPTLSDHDGGPGNKNHGVYRYYAIGDDAAQERKWRKRGTKLHLFNEHQFVAAHVSSSSLCHLCGRVFSRRPGKQGYKCRQCHLLLHKQCHVKVDHNCPYARRDGLQLEFIDADPPSGLVNEARDYAMRQQQQQQQQQQAAWPKADGGELTLANMGRTDPYQPLVRSAAGSGHAGRPKMRMAAKSISMEVDER